MQVHGITNMFLEKKKIDDNVIRQIAISDTIFFSETTKQAMLNYTDDESNDNKPAIILMMIEKNCMMHLKIFI